MPERALRAILVDDEAPARALLREYLGAHREITIIAECANGFDAVKRIREESPDVVFLDVQMPKLDGFEVLELISPGPAVVFCTAYDEFALRAFEVHAVDYLLKPFGRDRLAEALVRVRERIAARSIAGAAPTVAPAAVIDSAQSAPPAPARGDDDFDSDEDDDSARAPASPTAGATALAREARGPGRWAERVIVRDGAEIHVIPVAKIDALEAQDDYVAIHSAGKTWLKQQPLAELASTLDPARFVRVHRSWVLPVDRIARIETYAKDSRMAVLAEGREVPVSRSGYQRLRELMGS